MKRFDVCWFVLLLVATTPAYAAFVERFEPVWEEKGGDVVVSSSTSGKRAGRADFTDSFTGMEFVLVKGGCYSMGDTFGDGVSDEKPVHKVCVDDFYIGKYEVTNGQWQKVTDWYPPSFKNGDNYPVEQVSWNDVQDYLRQLNQKGNNIFRLPTEAEWEYAARSGGKQEKFAGGNNIDAVAWYSNNSDNSTHPVGEKQANGLGLYDMSGNVSEWIGDWYGDKYYEQSPKNNPPGLSWGTDRVDRGGNWNDGPEHVRSANRDRFSPVYRNRILGFRLAFSAR